jgi:D-arabinose 1-dehydrogenase-like Zn-dependent alcohol dehydrogenase
MYDPLTRSGCADGSKMVGIAGIGGLGMMGIKIAVAMGCKAGGLLRTSTRPTLNFLLLLLRASVWCM